VVRRAEMLAELMRLKWSIAVGGTHGKTTTTSLSPRCWKRPARSHRDQRRHHQRLRHQHALGAGDWMVVEADESDGSFLRLPAVIAVVTNMDPEHLDHWGTAEAMIAGYDQFVANIPFYGFAVLCIDHPAVQQMIPRCRTGASSPTDFRRRPMCAPRTSARREGSTFEVMVTDRDAAAPPHGPFRLPMLGQHNVQNALAAIAVGVEMEIDDATLRRMPSRLPRRQAPLHRTGEAGGITVIDDYGHHPVEIAAVLKAARQAGRARRDRGGAAASLHAGCSRCSPSSAPA
jgi:UDP-N-acetylmuramate--alanine ligase